MGEVKEQAIMKTEDTSWHGLVTQRVTKSHLSEASGVNSFPKEAVSISTKHTRETSGNKKH